MEALPGRYAVCRLKPQAAAPTWAAGQFVSVTRSDRECSVICRQESVPAGVVCQAGWRALRVQGKLPFDAVGVLAALAGALAEAQVSLLALATYDTDYLLVPEGQWAAAVAALQAQGHRVEGGDQG
ncbi:MAG: ACT domain-containing protein [Chloroflexi bacterium]|nr:ACT domain-containing protein [Chloroflexota bacterium]